MPARVPTVSIGLPVYNGENFLSETLDSWLAQTLGDFELIIGDNASTDRTGQICRDYAAKDRRIRYIRHARNLGAVENFNVVAKAATAKYFKWSAHDDLYAPDYLEKCVSVLHEDSSVILCHSRTTFIDGRGDRLRYDAQAQHHVDEAGLPRYLDPATRPLGSARPHVRFHAILHQTRLGAEVFGVLRRETLPKGRIMKAYFGSDRAMMAGLALKGRFFLVPEDLFFLRCHAAQSTVQTNRGRAEYATGRAPRWVRMSAALTYADFALALAGADIAPGEKLRCLMSWLALATTRNTLRKIFVPGRYNVFGIEFKSSR